MDPTAIITALISAVGGYHLGAFTVLQWATFVFSIVGFLAGILKVLIQMGLPLQSENRWVDWILAAWSKIAMHPAAAKARQPGLPARALAAKMAAKTPPAGTPAPKGFARFGFLIFLAFLAVLSMWLARPMQAYADELYHGETGAFGVLNSQQTHMILDDGGGDGASIAFPSIVWGVPSLSYGPSLALTEIAPSSSVVTSLSAGLGLELTIGEGQFAWLNKQWDILNLQIVVLGAPLLEGPTAAGAVQVGFMLSTLNGLIGFGPLLTPWTGAGGGFLQGGHPGTAWLLAFSPPISFSTVPNTAGGAHGGEYGGPLTLARGATTYIP